MLVSDSKADGKLDIINQPVWERQPGETSGQYLWFTRYRDARLEGGSLAYIRQKYDKKPGYEKTLRKWSADNRWVYRIEAYRDFLEGKKAEQRLKEIESMNERQSAYGRLMQQIAMQIISNKQNDREGLSLTMDQIPRWVEIGAKIERAARGAPTEIRADGELPEETRKRMESIYAQSMESAGIVVPKRLLKRQTDENAER